MLRLINRTLATVITSSRGSFKPILPYDFALAVHSFHTSATSLGRKTGSSALEFPVRAPSRKQLRKKSKLMETLKEKRDPVKEKIKLENIRKQVQSEGFQKKLQELGDR